MAGTTATGTLPPHPAPVVPSAAATGDDGGAGADDDGDDAEHQSASALAPLLPADIDAASGMQLDDVSPAFLPIVDSIHERLAALRAKCEGDVELLDVRDRVQETLYRRHLEAEVERQRRPPRRWQATC